MSKQNKTEEIIILLRQKLKEADDPALASDECSFDQWHQEIEEIFAYRFGEDSRQVNSFKTSLDQEVRIQRYFDEDENTEYRRRQIGYAKATLSAILSVIESLGLPAIQELTTPPKVFIPHGGETEALNKLWNFVDALGIVPLVAEKEASEDRSVNEQIEWCLNNADCAIILGTADDQNLKDGKLYPRPNVCIEIGRVQEKFPGGIIYLLEEGASFPSNISEKVYERFTQENMEKAYLKVVKELRAFGIIKTTAIRSQSDQNL